MEAPLDLEALAAEPGREGGGEHEGLGQPVGSGGDPGLLQPPPLPHMVAGADGESDLSLPGHEGDDNYDDGEAEVRQRRCSSDLCYPSSRLGKGGKAMAGWQVAAYRELQFHSPEHPAPDSDVDWEADPPPPPLPASQLTSLGTAAATADIDDGGMGSYGRGPGEHDPSDFCLMGEAAFWRDRLLDLAAQGHGVDGEAQGGAEAEGKGEAPQVVAPEAPPVEASPPAASSSSALQPADRPPRRHHHHRPHDQHHHDQHSHRRRHRHHHHHHHHRGGYGHEDSTAPVLLQVGPPQRNPVGVSMRVRALWWCAVVWQAPGSSRPVLYVPYFAAPSPLPSASASATPGSASDAEGLGEVEAEAEVGGSVSGEGSSCYTSGSGSLPPSPSPPPSRPRHRTDSHRHSHSHRDRDSPSAKAQVRGPSGRERVGPGWG
jgi:hypothetical protein